MATFQMEEQLLDQWCWAAVGASLANYVRPNSASQCQLASTALKVSGCCGKPVAPGCDAPYSLQSVLTETLGLLGKPAIRRPLTFAEVRQVIDAKWPIPLRIVWDDNPGNGHAVVISGYAVSAGPQVQVDDPFYGRSVVDYNVFVSNYRGAGQWERTYPIWEGT